MAWRERVGRFCGGGAMSTDEGRHPIIDGRPVLIGDRLRATDHDCLDIATGQDFTREGVVVGLLGVELPAVDDVVVTLKPDEGLTEEFSWPTDEFERVAGEGS